MKKIGEILDEFKVFLPTLLIAVIVITSLISYESPVVKINAQEMDNGNNESVAVTSEEKESEEKSSEESSVAGNFDLADGSYQGSGTGYGGKITVSVKIASKSIESIDIVSADGEDAAFFNRAKGVIDSMITKQSLDVDVVSGATYSSKGIIAAVKNALYQEEDEGSTQATTSAASLETVQEDSNQTYKDGTYTGSAQGFGGLVSVLVAIKEGKISSIKVTSAPGEGSSYLNKASSLINKIINKQSTNVDTVSGATYTSTGIINAVRKALAKAAVSGSSSEEELVTPSSTESAAVEEGESIDVSDIESGKFPYPNGTYYGTGTGFAGSLTVAITIKNSTITKAVVTKSSDDTAFLNKAKAILTKLVKNQSTAIDTVSGATYSSKGILEAISNALEKAKNQDSSTEDAKTTAATKETAKQTTQQATTVAEGTYIDGVYTVSVNCTPDERKMFAAYTLEMKVTIKNDKITAISHVKGSGKNYVVQNDAYITRIVEEMIPSIVLSGTYQNVDVVTRATCTSNAIIEGCKKALAAAKNTKSTQEETTQVPTTKAPETTQESTTKAPETTMVADTETSNEETSANITDQIYKEGTYTITTTCYPDAWEDFEAYTLSMKVTIKSDKITAITDIKGTGTGYDSFNDYYIADAVNGTSKKTSIVTQIIQKGMPEDIDAVTGATCSSNAIIEGCKAALAAAKIKG